MGTSDVFKKGIESISCETATFLWERSDATRATGYSPSRRARCERVEYCERLKKRVKVYASFKTLYKMRKATKKLWRHVARGVYGRGRQYDMLFSLMEAMVVG